MNRSKITPSVTSNDDQKQIYEQLGIQIPPNLIEDNSVSIENPSAAEYDENSHTTNMNSLYQMKKFYTNRRFDLTKYFTKNPTSPVN